MKVEGRIQAGLIAFACGDATGVPWETKRPGQIDVAKIQGLPRRDDWPGGAVSDDTVFLLSTARVLASGNATRAARAGGIFATATGDDAISWRDSLRWTLHRTNWLNS